MIGSNNSLIVGFFGPTQSPASSIFSAFILVFGGRLRMAKYTGHIDTAEERKRGTPSTDIASASVFSLEKNCPSADNSTNFAPSQTSVITLGSQSL